MVMCTVGPRKYFKAQRCIVYVSVSVHVKFMLESS